MLGLMLSLSLTRSMHSVERVRQATAKKTVRAFWCAGVGIEAGDGGCAAVSGLVSTPVAGVSSEAVGGSRGTDAAAAEAAIS